MYNTSRLQRFGGGCMVAAESPMYAVFPFPQQLSMTALCFGAASRGTNDGADCKSGCVGSERGDHRKREGALQPMGSGELGGRLLQVAWL